MGDEEEIFLPITPSPHLPIAPNPHSLSVVGAPSSPSPHLPTTPPPYLPLINRDPKANQTSLSTGNVSWPNNHCTLIVATTTNIGKVL